MKPYRLAVAFVAVYLAVISTASAVEITIHRPEIPFNLKMTKEDGSVIIFSGPGKDYNVGDGTYVLSVPGVVRVCYKLQSEQTYRRFCPGPGPGGIGIAKVSF